MGAGHHRPLYRPASTPLHRALPECKLVATVAFVFAVVATPREAFWAFAVFGCTVVALSLAAGVPLPTLGRRLALETPFVAFAVLLPLVASGPRVDVLGFSLSVAGLWGSWNIVVKATIGLAATTVLISTTSVPDLLRGLERLRLPRLMVAIATFMVRYGEVITGEMRTMRIARVSRGYDGRWLWQARAVASSAGTLFIRSYERGERVHLAMISRGFNGTLPVFDDKTASIGDWARALLLPAFAALVAVLAWGL